MELKSLSFHESSVAGIQNAHDSISFRLEDVRSEDEAIDGVLTAFGVHSIYEEQQRVSSIVPPFGDGEVLDIKHTNGSMELFIEWNNFANRISRTMHYVIACDRVTFEVISARQRRTD